MKTLLTSILFVTTLFLFYSFDMPDKWFKAGSAKKSYEMGIDSGKGRDGKNAATIKSKKNKIKGFGTMMQNCLPDKYLGKRVRMSGYMKSENVEDWAGFWLRIDQKEGNRALGFDNMNKRAIKGTTEWTKYEIVLDVPLKATNLAYGALLVGQGQIWFDDLSFEIVSDSIAVTGQDEKALMPLKEPQNLDFDE